MRSRRISKKILLAFALLLLIGLVELTVIMFRLNSDEASRSRSASLQSKAKTEKTFDKSRFSINEAESASVVVNKGRVLPRDYVPANLTVPNVLLRDSETSNNMHLRGEAAKALKKLFDAAAKDDLYLRLASGYRSYFTQANLYNQYVRVTGQKSADDYSARPGHSEHQTGLAADVAPSDLRCSIQPCFADTSEGRWLGSNAYKFGFIIRYPENLEKLTGYKYEPWHLRYLGSELAKEVKKSGQTLEQFFDLPAYSTYPSKFYELK